MKRTIIATGAVSLALVAGTGVAYAQGGSDPTAVDAATVLAPLAAAALGIERLIEMFWGIVESILSLSDQSKQSVHACLRMTTVERGTASEEQKTWAAGYKKFKTWTSPVLGIGIGLWVAFAAELMMFNLIGLGIVTNADMFITGLVVGSGSKFTHDVIGIFSETKKLIEEGAQFVKKKEPNG